MAAVLLAASLGACGGLRAEALAAARAGRIREALRHYERIEARDGPSRGLLASLAGELLLHEARRSDEPEAALQATVALGRAGVTAERWLRRLLDDPRLPGVARAEAALRLARLGSLEAVALLLSRAEAADPRVRARALHLARWPRDRAWVLRALARGAEEERVAACAVLAGGAPDRVAREALHAAARRDASRRVRAAALRALGAFGPAEVPLLLEATGEEALAVALAAVSAAVRAEPQRAADALRPLWADVPTVRSVAAARAIALRLDPSSPRRHEALAHLRSALAATEAAVRAQAAVAWLSVGVAEGAQDLRLRLAVERERSVRLQLARTLARLPPHRDAAAEAFGRLAEENDLVAALAAAELSRFPGTEPPRKGVEALTRLLKRGSVTVRAAAARGLALDAGQPERAAPALKDPSRRVQLEAAAAILQAVQP